MGCDTPFDDHGEHIGDTELETLHHEWCSCLNLSTVELPDPPELINSAVEARTAKENPINHLEFQPQLDWLNADIIKNTFKHTTQFYKRARSMPFFSKLIPTKSKRTNLISDFFVRLIFEGTSLPRAVLSVSYTMWLKF